MSTQQAAVGCGGFMDGVANVGRFRLDHYIGGEHVVGGAFCRAGDAEALAGHLFDTPEAAAERWLAVGWGYEDAEDHPDPESWDAAEALLSEAAMLVDQVCGRVVQVVTYREPQLGESRLPVAQVLDVMTGKLVTATIEQSGR